MDDIVRIGKITSIDYEKGMASVVYTDRNNEPSPQFPFFSVTYDMPKINDTAVVLLLQNSTTKGFILGIPWSRAKVPRKGGKGIFFKEFSDGSYISYNAETKQMEVYVNNIVLKSVTAQNIIVSGGINAETIEVDSMIADDVTVTQTANINNLTVSGTATITNLDVTGTATGHYPVT